MARAKASLTVELDIAQVFTAEEYSLLRVGLLRLREHYREYVGQCQLYQAAGHLDRGADVNRPEYWQGRADLVQSLHDKLAKLYGRVA